MTTQPQGDGRVHLGKLEWAAVLALVSGFVWFGQQQLSRLSGIELSVSELKTQSTVQTAQVQTLTQQLADVPRLTRDMAEMKVRVERVEQDVRDYHGRR